MVCKQGEFDTVDKNAIYSLPSGDVDAGFVPLARLIKNAIVSVL